MILRRNDFQRLAKLRAKEAQTLLKARCYHGAYYLAGLAVECAIKSCIATKTKRFEFHDLERARDTHIHEPVKLVKAAGLWNALDQQMKKNRIFRGNWGEVAKWGIDTRYEPRITPQKARELVTAVTDSPDGVLAWLEGHWNA